jgi:sarcosine oxidase subunit gamma
MAQRTVMEHLGVLILRTGDDAFMLLSASSSAKSFLHALETSVANVL